MKVAVAEVLASRHALSVPCFPKVNSSICPIMFRMQVKAHPFFKDINWDTLARQKAAFVPSPDTAHDTSYFTSRHSWNQIDARVFPEQEGDSSDYDCSGSSGSSSSMDTRREEGVSLHSPSFCPFRLTKAIVLHSRSSLSRLCM